MSHIKDIVTSMIHNGLSRHPKRATTTKILNRFMEEVMNEVLEGNIVEMPGNLGKIKVNKHIQDKLPPISKAKLFREGKRVRAANMNTLGYYFTIDCKSEYLERYGVKFKAGYKFRKLLSTRLRSGYDNYTMTWTPKKSQ